MNLPLPVKGVVPRSEKGITDIQFVICLIALSALASGALYLDSETRQSYLRHLETLCIMQGGTAFRRFYAPPDIPAVLCIDNRVLSVPREP